MRHIPKAAEYGSRGGNARAHRWIIEGKSYTTAEVAERLGIAKSTAYDRLHKRKHTWEDLK